MNIEYDSIHISPQNPPQDRPHLTLNDPDIARVFQHLLNSPEIPEGGIHRIISILGLIVGEIVRQDAVLFMRTE